MKVYELIQELAQYDADKEMEFRFVTKFDADVKAEFDRESEDDIQEVTVEVSFDDIIEYDYLDNNRWDKDKVIMKFIY